MSWENAYNTPEKLGLEIVGIAADLDAGYEFSLFAVWRDGSGQLYYATDSGCSCPSPFEGYTSVESLEAATVAEIHAALDSWDNCPGTRSEAVELHGVLAAL